MLHAREPYDSGRALVDSLMPENLCDSGGRCRLEPDGEILAGKLSVGYEDGYPLVAERHSVLTPFTELCPQLPHQGVTA